MKRQSAVFKSVRLLTLAAMLTAISVVIGVLCKNFLNFGGGLFRITFENMPIILAGVILGPAAGCAVGVASDLVSYLLSSQVYPPNLVVTLGAASVGVVSGLVAKLLRGKGDALRLALSGVAAHAVGSLVIKTLGLYKYYGIMVLWRIPIYALIAPIEIAILIWLFKHPATGRLFEGVKEKK